MNNWYVETDCCTLGNCIRCMNKTPVGYPIRVVHMERLSEKKAKEVAKNWASYNGVARQRILQGTLDKGEPA